MKEAPFLPGNAIRCQLYLLTVELAQQVLHLLTLVTPGYKAIKTNSSVLSTIVTNRNRREYLYIPTASSLPDLENSSDYMN